jgi:hypothetical protein
VLSRRCIEETSGCRALPAAKQLFIHSLWMLMSHIYLDLGFLNQCYNANLSFVTIWLAVLTSTITVSPVSRLWFCYWRSLPMTFTDMPRFCLGQYVQSAWRTKTHVTKWCKECHGCDNWYSLHGMMNKKDKLLQVVEGVIYMSIFHFTNKTIFLFILSCT